MVVQDKNHKALKAVQGLIIKARSMAFDGVDKTILFNFLDELEYLPALILEEGDRTELFEDYLKSICSDFNCPEVWNHYNVE